MVVTQDKYVQASLKLIPTSEGGRLTGIRNYYRPNHVFVYVEGQILCTYIGEIQFDSPDIIEPGEEKNVVIRFLNVPELEQYLVVGRKWWIHEGGRKVGEAIITNV